MKIFAKNLSVMIKHCNKNVIKRLKNRTFTQIVAKTNTTIDHMKKELQKFASINNSSKNQILIFQHFRSENIKLFVRKKKKRDVFSSTFSINQIVWCRNQNAMKIFEILMHFVKINIFIFHNDRNITIVIETLIIANTTQISKLNAKEIVSIKWLKKVVFDENEQINVVLKFIFVETINAVI
jgi:hypothetical protein